MRVDLNGRNRALTVTFDECHPSSTSLEEHYGRFVPTKRLRSTQKSTHLTRGAVSRLRNGDVV